MADKPQELSPNSPRAFQAGPGDTRLGGSYERGGPRSRVPVNGAAPTVKAARQLSESTSFLVSFLIHAVGIALLAMTTLRGPKRPSVVPVFEIVNLQKPKLRPIQPKRLPPPEPPKPEPQPVKPLDAPKLTPKPTKAVAPKAEPKVVKETPPEPQETVKEVVQEEQNLLPQIVAHVPADPRLSFWASRIKKKAETLWNPPSGVEVSGKTVVSFKVLRDGTVLDAQIVSGVGNSDIDQYALMTIQRMERVAPIPENYPEEEIQVSYEFVYTGQ